MDFNDNIIFFGTKSIDKVHKFYGEFLGLTVYMDQDVCRLYSLPGGGRLGFCEHMDVSEKGAFITFVTDEVDKIYEKFIQKGIECDQEPRINERFKLYHFFAKDFDGNTVEVQKFL